MEKKIEEIIEKLSPLEIKVIPFLNQSVEEIQKQTGLDSTSVLRALKFLENKALLKVKIEKKKIIGLGTNGVYYKKTQLPERRLISILENQNYIPLEEAKKISKLSDNEFNASLGILKDKAIIEIKNGKITLVSKKEELSKKMLEEKLIEALPLEEEKLEAEQKYAFENLKKRKDIVETKEEQIISFELTELGEKIAGKKITSDFLEEVTPEVIKNWKKTNKFRKYDIKSEVPRLYGGKKHFVSEAIEKGKRIWLELGFKEMSSTLTQTSFWNFDALFTAQDHPVRELHDTFFIKGLEGTLPEKKLVAKVKEAHEQGVEKSTGWRYSWQEDEAKKVVLRTHTTCLSAKTLATLKKEDLPAKFFAIGKCFRNETVDWSHGFEFYQSEGIVIDENVTLKHLLGYLLIFYKKMGFEKVRFTPAYFPYTEPSVEISAFHPEKKVWLELGGSGIFRPEITVPLMGLNIPVLAWGQGFDRIITDYYKIKDLRELYENDIKKLRERKILVG